MKIHLIKIQRKDIPKDTLDIKIEFNNENREVKKFINYIEKYKKSVFVQKDYNMVEVFYDDIICFFSDDKNNYCKTIDNTYKLKLRLYEIEKMSIDFMRISKKCIINIQHIKNFDVSKTGKIVINLDDGSSQYVSKRRIRDVLEFLDERKM